MILKILIVLIIAGLIMYVAPILYFIIPIAVVVWLAFKLLPPILAIIAGVVFVLFFFSKL